MCFLVGSLPNGLVFRHELANHRSTIGRLGISTILLEEESISALHAELIRVGDRKYLLRDLRSRNGTSVDGEKVSEAEIKAPCRLEFGHLSCELQSCESESCMTHGKTPSPAGSGALIQRPLAAPVPMRPGVMHDDSARHRKSRPLSRKRRAKHAAAMKIALGDRVPAVAAATEPRRGDTVRGSFAAPSRHAGDPKFKVSPKLVALVASVVLFGALAIGYSGPRHPSKGVAKAPRAPQVPVLLASVLPTPAAAAPEPEKGGDASGLAANEPVIETPSVSAIAAAPIGTPESAASPVAAPAPLEPAAPLPAAPLLAVAKADSTPAPGPEAAAGESDPEFSPTALTAAEPRALLAVNQPAPAALAPAVQVSPAAGTSTAEPSPAVEASTPPTELSPRAEASQPGDTSPVNAPLDPESLPAAVAAETSPTVPAGQIPRVAPADAASEEALVVEEAKLLASVSKAEPPLQSIPVAPLVTEEEDADAPDPEQPAPVDFSMPMAAPSPRRAWEAIGMEETELALNDFSRLVAPWSLETGAARIGGGDVASLFRRSPTVKVPVPVPVAKPVVQEPVGVMILGDSLALCGFGSRLDRRFRESANVRSTNTYMACGTVPMSWLKEPPYSNLKTYCGFWSIEDPVAANKKPMSFQDTYGMGKGKPKPYSVPKLEDLVAKAAPDVLILQTGTNLFSLFRDGKTVLPEQHGPMLRGQIEPFLAKILKMPQPPRAIYWVAAPTSGRVAPEVQDFVIQQITEIVGPMAKIVDSRQLVSFPYRHMEPDKEHFIGQDMDQWADRVYDIVQRDLAAQPLPLALARPPGLPMEKAAPVVAKGAGKGNLNDPTAVRLTAKLIGKTKPMRIEELRPYQESLVSYVYDVQKVTDGEYNEAKIVVMHPAHIGRVSQPLERLRVGKTYELSVHQIDGSPWFNTKSRDDFGLHDLLPYIQLADEARFPGHQP